VRSARIAVVLATSLCLAVATLPAQSALAAVGELAAVDDLVTTVAETATVVDVLANDTWVDPAVLVPAAAGDPGAPAHGSLALTTVDASGSTRPAVSYTPAAGFYGADSFSYRLTDGSTGSATATVRVTVTPTPPTTAPDTALVDPGARVRLDVLANDSDPYAGDLLVTAVSDGAHGTTAVVDSGAAITYASTVGWVGDESVTYTVTAASGATATGIATITTLPATPGHAARLAVPTRAVALRPVRLTGVVAPTSVSPVVTVQRWTGARWTSYAGARANAAGAFSVSWTPDRTGAFTFRALAVWPDGSSAISPGVTSTVVASADPVVSGPLTRAAVPWSYRLGCPVPPSSLRRLTLTYRDYTGTLRRGEIILAARAVNAVRAVFVTAFQAGFRFKRIVPTDAFYGRGTVSPTQSDIRAMAAGATSAYNCRSVTGSRYRISEHSFGDAIDVNTFENPYATTSRIYPAAAAQRYYIERSRHLADMGVISPVSVVARAFAARRWLWGARWARHDYQHFSANGG
jgi:hypothetical protein